MPGRRVVITGMAALTSLDTSDSLDSFWDALCEGKSGIGNIDTFDTSGYKTHFGGQIKDFDPTPYIDSTLR